MATQNKAQDPLAAAMSAIEDALNLPHDDGLVDTARALPAAAPAVAPAKPSPLPAAAFDAKPAPAPAKPAPLPAAAFEAKAAPAPPAPMPPAPTQ